MAKILILGVVLSALLSFHVALGDGGWVIPSHGMEHICRSTHDDAAIDLCRIFRGVRFIIPYPYLLSARVDKCILVSLKFVFRPQVGLFLLVCAELHLEFGPLLYLRIEVTARVQFHTATHGLSVHSCAIAELLVKARSDLLIDAILKLTLDACVRVLPGLFCERGRAWCREMNYCFDFDPHPFPISPHCYGVWRSHSPHVAENEVRFRCQPVCTCRDMEEGVSVNLDSAISFQITVSPTDHSYYFCHEQDLSYIFECMRKRGYFDDLLTSVSLTVAVLLEHIPTLVFSCPETAHIVLKIECTRIYVEMHSGHALLCIRLRVSIGCDALNFVSSLTFTVTGCLNLHLSVDCRRELLLLVVSLRSALRIRGTCTEADGCENQDKLLTEIFLHQMTAWCLSLINAKISGGIRLPFLIYYPCDRCQPVTYAQHRVYCPCTLRYVHR